jgi:hypothetical protein
LPTTATSRLVPLPLTGGPHGPRRWAVGAHGPAADLTATASNDGAWHLTFDTGLHVTHLPAPPPADATNRPVPDCPQQLLDEAAAALLDDHEPPRPPHTLRRTPANVLAEATTWAHAHDVWTCATLTCDDDALDTLGWSRPALVAGPRQPHLVAADVRIDLPPQLPRRLPALARAGGRRRVALVLSNRNDSRDVVAWFDLRDLDALTTTGRTAHALA